MSTAPREILAYGPPGGEFRKDDYPWLRAVRLCVRAGDGGAATDGTPGEPGETRFATLPVEEVSDLRRISLGRGGRGAPGAQDGEDGFALIELYDQEPDPA